MAGVFTWVFEPHSNPSGVRLSLPGYFAKMSEMLWQEKPLLYKVDLIFYYPHGQAKK